MPFARNLLLCYIVSNEGVCGSDDELGHNMLHMSLRIHHLVFSTVWSNAVLLKRWEALKKVDASFH